MAPLNDVDATVRRAGDRVAARAAVRAVGGGPALFNHPATLAFLATFLLQNAVVTSLPWMRMMCLLAGGFHLWRVYVQLRLRSLLRQPLTVVVAVAGPARAALFSDALGRTMSLWARPRHARLAAVEAADQASAIAAELGCSVGHPPLCPHQLTRAGLASRAELREALLSGALPAT